MNKNMERKIAVRINREAFFRYLAEQNLSQNALASMIDISSGYMSQLINWRRCPSPSLRRRMFKAFSPLTFHDLFVIENKDMPR